MEILNTILNFILNNLMATSIVGTIVLELVFRIVKTSKPLSIAWMIHDVLAIVGKIFAGVALYLDKILPQRLV